MATWTTGMFTTACVQRMQNADDETKGLPKRGGHTYTSRLIKQISMRIRDVTRCLRGTFFDSVFCLLQADGTRMIYTCAFFFSRIEPLSAESSRRISARRKTGKSKRIKKPRGRKIKKRTDKRRKIKETYGQIKIND